ncbi:hypothetical protein HMPREF3226_00844 [Prevotella corporis]|uniref:Uncharacterized protein n=1 Tax=Prevotella corporis TaxID=28128 RepID=A0A133QF52_9BACT|nr:hypothetical protein HMPREF3226_00844 [Prevotella corporis]
MTSSPTGSNLTFNKEESLSDNSFPGIRQPANSDRETINYNKKIKCKTKD